MGRWRRRSRALRNKTRRARGRPAALLRPPPIGVQRGFPAEVAGLARGDVITKINQSPVGSMDVVKAVDAAYTAKPAPTLFEVQRERRVSLVVLKP